MKRKCALFHPPCAEQSPSDNQLQPTKFHRFQQGLESGSGPGGRRFKSSLPDQSFQAHKLRFWFFVYSSADDFVTVAAFSMRPSHKSHDLHACLQDFGQALGRVPRNKMPHNLASVCVTYTTADIAVLMVCRVLSVAFALCMLAVSSGQQVHAAGRHAASLQPILDVLDKAKLSGSLEFSGNCDMGSFPNFPPLRSPATRSGDSPLQTLREMFADYPAMQVTRATDGTIRMIETGVPTDLPDLRLRHALFENGSYALYNPNDALRFILRAPEMTAFMKDHDIGWPYTSGAVGPPGQPWPTELPHISGSLENVVQRFRERYVI